MFSHQCVLDCHRLQVRDPLLISRRPLLQNMLILNLWSGNGDITPVTSLGKGLCVVYAVFGNPITILLFKVIGQQILRGERSLITAIEKHCLGRNRNPSCLNGKFLLLAIVYFLLLLLIGAAAYMKAEGWSYVDGLYIFLLDYFHHCRLRGSTPSERERYRSTVHTVGADRHLQYSARGCCSGADQACYRGLTRMRKLRNWLNKKRKFEEWRKLSTKPLLYIDP